MLNLQIKDLCIKDALHKALAKARNDAHLQLYAVVGERSPLDRELDSCRTEGHRNGWVESTASEGIVRAIAGAEEPWRWRDGANGFKGSEQVGNTTKGDASEAGSRCDFGICDKDATKPRKGGASKCLK